MATQDSQNPLLSLSQDKQQKLVDLVEDGNINAVADATGMERRDILKIAAALGVGTVAGGISAQELISEARAAASTTDGDGNVGLPGDRVDLFAESADVTNEISSGSINTDEATIGGYDQREEIASYGDESDFGIEDVSGYDVTFIEVDNVRLNNNATLALRINGASTSDYNFTQRGGTSFSTGSGTEIPLLDTDGSFTNSTAIGGWRVGHNSRPALEGSGYVARITGLVTIGAYLDIADNDITDLELFNSSGDGSISVSPNGITISGR